MKQSMVNIAGNDLAGIKKKFFVRTLTVDFKKIHIELKLSKI